MSNLDLINENLQSASETMNRILESVGMMSIKSANQWSEEASKMPNPTPLWLSLWNQGECCVLFADSNLGKSIYAVQIAEHIARNTNQKVLYFDFELSQKQFQMRYSNAMGGLYRFSDNLLRAEMDLPAMRMTPEQMRMSVIDNIVQCVVSTGARILIIDNLTFLCTQTEKGDLAGDLSMELIRIKRDYGLSMLILAHTPKRPMQNPITQNDLAGSKKLINFVDSAFAIGKSAKDTNLRYIKQIKCRATAFEYGDENVIVCSVEKNDSFLQFNKIGTARESEHLKVWKPAEFEERSKKAVELHKAGKSYDDIAKELSISKTTAFRIVKEFKENEDKKANAERILKKLSSDE